MKIKQRNDRNREDMKLAEKLGVKPWIGAKKLVETAGATMVLVISYCNKCFLATDYCAIANCCCYHIAIRCIAIALSTQSYPDPLEYFLCRIPIHAMGDGLKGLQIFDYQITQITQTSGNDYQTTLAGSGP